jgi:hypothetical protein
MSGSGCAHSWAASTKNLSIHARSEIDEHADTVIRVIFETVD